VTTPASVRPHGPESALPTERLRALAAAHGLLEQLQDRPGDERVLARLEEWSTAARAAGWAEVQVFLMFGALVHADLTGADPDRLRQLADGLLATATSYDEEPLIGLAVAARPSHLIESGQAEPFGDDLAGCLAHVVALLEDLVTGDSGPAMLVPAAYVECAQGYRRQDLWELELEMYDLADASLVTVFGPLEEVAADHPARAVLDLNRRVLLFNRLESTVSLVCALLEVGRREEARAAALDRRRFTPLEWADLPSTWALEARAMDRLLAVVAGETCGPGDPAVVPTDLYAAVSESAWGGYAACLLLAAALVNQESGELHAAVRLGSAAVGLLDDFRPSLRTLAMHLTTLLSAPDEPARRYAEHLARLRWESRVQVLDAARSRRSAARVLRQGELLRRQAYVDQLTGLANRHDYVRHLAALRHAEAGDQVTVALIDLDRFKAVNDTFGHPVGDEVLRTIGRILASAVRSSDLAVRLGGDEFALLVGSGADATIEGRVSGIVETVREQDWGALAPGLLVTASAGIATGPAIEVDRLLQEADQRLYRAKAAGRDRAAG